MVISESKMSRVSHFVKKKISSLLATIYSLCKFIQKQPSRGVFKKRCSENMQQIYRRTPMPKCDYNKVAFKFTGEHPCRGLISINLRSNFIVITVRHGCSPVNLLHIFRIHLLKNTSGRLLLFI